MLRGRCKHRVVYAAQYSLSIGMEGYDFGIKWYALGESNPLFPP